MFEHRELIGEIGCDVSVTSVHDRYMVSMWPAYGQYVVGIRSVCGRYMVSMWSINGQYVVDIWSVCGRYMIGIWSVCGRYMVIEVVSTPSACRW